MRLPARFASLVLLLVATATGAWATAEIDDVVVDIESMIGEAVLIRKGADGQADTIVVPTGQATQTDPVTGETEVEESTVPNAVNEVVRAIAAASPDALSGSTAEGCSRGNKPIRPTANPSQDPAVQATIRKMLAELSEGELMMVIAVLNNNARHLCIDTVAVSFAISEIAAVRPEAAAQVVFVAALIDPANAAQYAATAQAAAPGESGSIQQAIDDAEAAREELGTESPSSGPTAEGETSQEPEDPAGTETDAPPGGEPPSPE